MILSIKDLHVSIQGKEILRGINLDIRAGEVHAIMGPNGSGKSTLAQAIAGQENYEITEGTITYFGKDLLDLAVDERARAGIFLAFQYPVEIPGVSTAHFLKSTVNAIREGRGQEDLSAIEMLKFMRSKIRMLDMDEKFLSRSLNDGFSGGEKKKNEILQMAMLEPTLAILDETDSGLDIDALKIVAAGVNTMRNRENAFIVVTHYQRLLNFIVPDFVHVLHEGRIVKSGGKELALKLEEEGYDWIKNEAAAITE